MDAVPHAGMSLLLLIFVFSLIGLFIFFMVRVGKNRPSMAALIVGGFVSVWVAGVFLGMARRMVEGPVPMKVWPLAAVGVLVALGIAFAAGGRGVRIGIAVLAAVAMPAFLMFHFWTFTPSVRETVEYARPAAVAREESATVSLEPAIWEAGVMDDFAADVYPSKRAAALELARRVAEEGSVQRLLANEDVSREILLLADGHDAELLSELGGEIARRVGMEGVSCSVVQDMDDGQWRPGVDDASAGQLQVQIRVRYEDVTTARAPWGGDVTSGKAVMQVKGPGSPSATTVDFAEKPWVENFSNFLTRHAEEALLVAKSIASCTTRTEAQQQAMGNACTAVSGIMRHTAAPSRGNLSVEASDLTSAGLIVDRFTQRFAGMSGPIWREALLVDISDDKMQELAGRKMAMLRRERATWAKMGLTLAGMFALISAVYVFLNAATRGYYTWALRVAVVVLMGAGVFFLLLLA